MLHSGSITCLYGQSVGRDVVSRLPVSVAGWSRRHARGRSDAAPAAPAQEIRLYTNEAMTANLAYYPRHGYTETHRAHEDGFRRVFFAKQLGAQAGTFGP